MSRFLLSFTALTLTALTLQVSQAQAQEAKRDKRKQQQNGFFTQDNNGNAGNTPGGQAPLRRDNGARPPAPPAGGVFGFAPPPRDGAGAPPPPPAPPAFGFSYDIPADEPLEGPGKFTETLFENIPKQAKEEQGATKHNRDIFVKETLRTFDKKDIALDDLAKAFEENPEGARKAAGKNGVKKLIDFVFEEGERRDDPFGGKVKLNDDGDVFYKNGDGREFVVKEEDFVNGKLRAPAQENPGTGGGTEGSQEQGQEQAGASSSGGSGDSGSGSGGTTAPPKDVPVLFNAEGHIVSRKNMLDTGPDASGEARGTRGLRYEMNYTQSAPEAASPEMWYIPHATAGVNTHSAIKFTDDITGDGVTYTSQGRNMVYFHGREAESMREFAGVAGRPLARDKAPESGFEFFHITPELHLPGDAESAGLLNQGFKTVHEDVLPQGVDPAKTGTAPVIIDWNTGRMLGTSIIWEEDGFGAQGMYGTYNREGGAGTNALDGEFASMFIGREMRMEGEGGPAQDPAAQALKDFAEFLKNKQQISNKAVADIYNAAGGFLRDVVSPNAAVTNMTLLSVLSDAGVNIDLQTEGAIDVLTDALKAAVALKSDSGLRAATVTALFEDAENLLAAGAGAMAGMDEDRDEHPAEGAYFGTLRAEHNRVFGAGNNVEGFFLKGQDTLNEDENGTFRVKHGVFSTEKSPVAFGDELAGKYSATEYGFAAGFMASESLEEEEDPGFDAFLNIAPEHVKMTRDKDNNEGRGSVGLDITLGEDESDIDFVKAKLGSDNPEDNGDGNLYFGKNVYGIGMSEDTITRIVDNETAPVVKAAGFAAGANPLNTEAELCAECEYANWGVWAHVAEYESTPSEEDDGNFFEAMIAPFVTGQITENLGDLGRTGTADYSGGMLGQIIGDGGVTAAQGSFTAKIDMDNRAITGFNADLAGRNFGFAGENHAIPGEGMAAFHNISVEALDAGDAISGHINGALFGPNAENIGGNFVTGGSLEATGVYLGKEN